MSDTIRAAVDRICRAVPGARERKIVLTEMRVIVAVLRDLLDKAIGEQGEGDPADVPGGTPCSYRLTDGEKCGIRAVALIYIADLESGLFEITGRCGAHRVDQ